MQGRKARGPEIVHDLNHGSQQARTRAEAVLRVVSGELGVEEGAATLDLTPQQLHNLRAQGLRGLIDALEQQPMGRPRKETESEEMIQLRQENARLQRELEAARVREEIDLVLPARKKTSKKKGTKPG